MPKQKTETLKNNHERFVHWMKVIVKNNGHADVNAMSKAIENVPFYKLDKKIKTLC